MRRVVTKEFLVAVKKGDVNGVRALLKSDPTLINARDEIGISTVLLAAYHGHMDFARSLASMKSGLDLFEASATGRTNLVHQLVRENPGIVNSFSVDGFTPLHLAVFFHNFEIAGLLLSNKAPINAVAKNPSKVQPLHSAIAANDTAIIELLILHGADVNATQQGGFTALHGAAQNGNLEAAILLLSHGANTNARTEKGKTPLAITSAEGRESGSREDRERVAEFLRDHGAE